jgi:3-oxoacyl-[acyl-carrier protein] reductase
MVASLDIESADSQSSLCDLIHTEFGPLDAIISLVGDLPGKSLIQYEDLEMERVMRVNFTSQAALIRRLIPAMRPGSHILLMASISGQRGSFDPIYAAAKGAIIAFTKSLATSLTPNIRVNAIAPALIEESTMYLDMDPDRRAIHRQNSPTGRLNTRSEIAHIIVDLLQPHWSNLNGQIIAVNGGSYV